MGKGIYGGWEQMFDGREAIYCVACDVVFYVPKERAVRFRMGENNNAVCPICLKQSALRWLGAGYIPRVLEVGGV